MPKFDLPKYHTNHLINFKRDHGCALMVKGNQMTTRENLGEEAHQRRMKGLYKAWDACYRIQRGENVVRREVEKAKAARKRIRLQETVAKEAREIQETARKRAQAAMDRLQNIIDSPVSKDSDAIAAAQVILDRAYGKASQTHITANVGANGKNAEITGSELNQRIEKALGRINSLTGGEPKAPESTDKPSDLRERDRNTGGSGGTVH